MTHTHRMTRASAREWGLVGRWRYSDARIAELVPPWGLLLEEVAALDIPPEDRVWALVSACGASLEVRVGFARMCESRADDYAAAAAAARVVGLGGAACAAAAARAAAVVKYAAWAAQDAAYGPGDYDIRTRALATTRAAYTAADVVADCAAVGGDERQWQIDTLVALLQGAEH
jgi:hypothetical protein